MEQNWKSQRGWDLKNCPLGRYGNFMEPHIKTYKISANMGKKPLQEHCSLQSKGTIGRQRLTRAEHTLTILSIKGIWFSLLHVRKSVGSVL